MSKDLGDIIAELNEDPRLTTYSQTDRGEINDWIPSLIPVFDYNMVGGIPSSGRVSQCYGKKSSGKSTFSGTIVKNAIKMGMVVVYFDTEGTQDNSRLESLGVDTNKVLTYTATHKRDGTVQQMSIEEIGRVIINILAKIHTSNPDVQTLFVWDSVGFTESEMQVNTELGNQVVGQQARALATVGRKLQGNLILNNGCLLAINQGRADFNAVNPRYASVKSVGGFGWAHLLSTDISFTQSGKIYAKSTDTVPIGTETKIKVTKSKVGDNWGSSFKIALIGDDGYDFEYNLVLEGQDAGIISTGRAPKILDATISKDQSSKFINENNGEVLLSGRNIMDLVKKLKEPENQAIRDQLWQHLIKAFFPQCYQPLFNTGLIMHEKEFPMIKGLRAYYIHQQQNLDPIKQNYNYKHFMEAYKNKDLPDDIMKEVKEALKGSDK